jgi:hypothetical protein
MLLDFYGQRDWAIAFNALKCFRYSSLPSIHFCNFRHLNVKESPRNYRWRIHWLVGEHCYNRRGDSPREQFLLLHNCTASWNMKRLNLEQQLLWYSTWDPYLLAKTFKRYSLRNRAVACFNISSRPDSPLHWPSILPCWVSGQALPW